MSVRLTIDGREIQVESGASILDAATNLGIRIPRLCHADGLKPAASCFLCVVQVDGNRNLVPSCEAPAQDGMVVTTDSDDIRAARKMALELLLSDHTGDCVAPCSLACPARLDIPAFIGHLAAGRHREAIAVVKERIPLPSALARICPRYCERVCRRRDRGQAVAICALARFAADVDAAEQEPYVPPRCEATGKRAAVVGAGPAGLSAAFYLLQDGHACTIFDAHSDPGGAFRYAVPESRLPKQALDADIEVIRRLGAEFRMNVRLGADFALDDLRRDYDAVFLACSKSGIKADRRTLRTNLEGVFAGGKAVSGPDPGVRAVAAGHLAATCIHQYLSGREVTGEPRPVNVHMGKLTQQELAVLFRGVEESPRVRQASFEEVAQGLSESDAIKEAERCLQCDCLAKDDCKLRQYATEYRARVSRFKGERRPFDRDDSHPDVVYEPGKCILCGICVRIADQAGESPGMAFTRRGFPARVGVPFEKPLAEALSPETARRCAEACPTGALALKRKHSKPRTGDLEPKTPCVSPT